MHPIRRTPAFAAKRWCTDRPRDRQGPRLKAPAHTEIAIMEDLGFDAPLAVVPQLARAGVMLSRSWSSQSGSAGRGTTRGVGGTRPGA